MERRRKQRAESFEYLKLSFGRVPVRLNYVSKDEIMFGSSCRQDTKLIGHMSRRVTQLIIFPMETRCIDWVMNYQRSAEMGCACIHLYFLSSLFHHFEAVIDTLVMAKEVLF